MRLEIFFKIGFSLKSNYFDFEIVNFPFLDGDVPRSPSYGVYISQLIRFARVFSNIDDFNNRTLFLTAKLLKQGYRYNKIRKAFSKLYHRDSELIVKYNIRLKVSNGAKIRNRYNQVPHLTQDTNGKVTNLQKTPQTRAKRSALSQQVTTKHI